jgi:hypothetical protein
MTKIVLTRAWQDISTVNHRLIAEFNGQHYWQYTESTLEDLLLKQEHNLFEDWLTDTNANHLRLYQDILDNPINYILIYSMAPLPAFYRFRSIG